jgi:hypothetical protein
MVVPLFVSITFEHVAGTRGWPSISIRWNVIPESGGAGLKVTVTSTPVCNPLPVTLTGDFTVLCFSLVIIGWQR